MTEQAPRPRAVGGDDLGPISITFYARRSQKHKKYSQAISLFALLGFARIKTEC